MEEINKLIKKYEEKKTLNEQHLKFLDPEKHKANTFYTKGRISAYNSILRDLKELKK